MAGERCHFADRYLPGAEIEAVHRTLPSESLFNVNEDPNVSDLEQVTVEYSHTSLLVGLFRGVCA